MPEEPLESHAWRVFRIFLSQLEDAELETVSRQLHHERAARQERDHDATRLLFSSLSGSDLEMAGGEILTEQRARVEDLQMPGRITATETSAPTSTNLNGPPRVMGDRPQEPRGRLALRYNFLRLKCRFHLLGGCRLG